MSDEEDIVMDYVMQDAVIESKLYEDAYLRERRAGRKRRDEREYYDCLLYTSPSPRDLSTSRMPSSA